MGMAWEEPLAALERTLHGNRKRDIKREVIDTNISMTPPEGTCQRCGDKDVYRRDLCKPCWRLDVQYAEERA